MNDIATVDHSSLTRKDRFFLALLRFFSRRSLRFLQGFGFAVGWLAYRLRRLGRTQVVRRNLEICFPEKDAAWLDETTERCMISMAQTMAEFAKTWGMSTDYSISQIKNVHNEHIFHEALAAGRGTIGIIPHYGTWEFMNAWVNQYASPIIMYKPGKQKGVDAFVRDARGRLRAIMVATDERGVKTIFKGLKQNGFIGILPDHIPHDNGGIYAPLFGISTWTGIMVPRLVGRTGCTAIVMYCLRRPDADGFDIFFEKPDPEIYSQDVAVSAAAMNRSIEAVIRRDPAHYQWSYKRFKKNENLANPYW
jgi:KDO2-lipid IV(A) lauroyltransferase